MRVETYFSFGDICNLNVELIILFYAVKGNKIVEFYAISSKAGVIKLSVT